ncbi:MAG: adenosine deaminase [Pseudomonadota bacterium]
MTLKNMPKVELHLHLEGAAPPEFIRSLAQEKTINLSGVFTENGAYRFENFNQFLATYEAACTVLTGPQEFLRLTEAVLEQSQDHGVVYSEVFLSPDFCGTGDLGAWREYLAAIEEAADKSPVSVRAIVTCIRHLGPEEAKKSALCAAETAGAFITGFGMGGDEMRGSQKDFAYSFDMAREAGLQLTTHAGEWGGAREVRDALDHLNVERIGHGVGAATDDALMDRLADTGVMLEVCPGSNVSLGVARSWSDHPIELLRRRGVKVSVSTDDPPFFHTNLTSEYEHLANTFGWEAETFSEINRDAIASAFCDAATKDDILKKLEPTP